MTCDEFRQANSGGVAHILELTRAERSAAAKHWTECFECREWTNTFNFRVTNDQRVQVELAKVTDRSDPEAWKAIPKERAEMSERFDLDSQVPVNKEVPK